MATFTNLFNTETLADWTYDDAKIDWTFGENPKLKTLPLASKLSGGYRFKTQADILVEVLGNAGSSLGGAPSPTITQETTFPAVTDGVISGSGTSYFRMDNLAPASQIYSQTVTWNCDPSTGAGVKTIFTLNRINGITVTVDQNDTGITTYVYYGANVVASSSFARTADGLKTFTLKTEFVANGGNWDITNKFYDSGALLDTKTLINVGAPSFYSAGSRVNELFRYAGVAATPFSGFINNFNIFDEALSDIEIQAISDNLGVVNLYDSDSPTLTKNTSFTDGQLITFSGYSVASSGTGSIAGRLTRDNYATTEYWTGSVWSMAGSSYNSASTINAEISSFSADEKSIESKLVFVSDGFQQVELSQEQFSYAVNVAPTIGAGLNKPIAGNALITNTASAAPYSDLTLFDSDGTLASFWSAVDGGSYVQVPIGIYATLQEAGRAYLHDMSLLSIGAHTFTAKVIDDLGAEATDSVVVNVISSIDVVVNDNNAKLTTLLANLATTDGKVDTTLTSLTAFDVKVDTAITNISAVDATLEDLHDWYFGTESEVTTLGVLTRLKKDGTLLITQQGTSDGTQTNLDITKLVKQ